MSSARSASTCSQGHRGGATSCCGHRPQAVGIPADSNARSTNRVLPMPGSPSTSTTVVRPACALSRASARAARASVRPTNGASLAAPRDVDVDVDAATAAGAGGAGCSCGSWRRIATSSCCRSGPGSMPSSSASRSRAERNACSASACRPQRQSATASSSQDRSRNGCVATCASRSVSAACGRPSASSARARCSTALSRSSSSRVTSRSAQSASRTSA